MDMIKKHTKNGIVKFVSAGNLVNTNTTKLKIFGEIIHNFSLEARREARSDEKAFVMGKIEEAFNLLSKQKSAE